MKRLIVLQVILCAAFVFIGFIFSIIVKPSIEYRLSRPSKIIKNIRPNDLMIKSDIGGSLKIKPEDPHVAHSMETLAATQVSRSLYIYSYLGDDGDVTALFKEFRKVFKGYIISQGGTPSNVMISGNDILTSFHNYSIGSRYGLLRLHAVRGHIVMDITEVPIYNGVWAPK